MIPDPQPVGEDETGVPSLGVPLRTEVGSCDGRADCLLLERNDGLSLCDMLGYPEGLNDV